jgi:hypothetical protein
MAGIVPQGATPTTQAVTGALAQLRMRAMSNPDRKPVLVMATDGLPSSPDCLTDNTINAASQQLSAASIGTPSIPTYVIGIFGANQSAQSMTQLGQLATAGGTGMPFLLTTGGTDLRQQFLDKLNTIRGTALGCEFAIPKPAMGANLDFNQVNVRVKAGMTTEDLGYTKNAAGCDPVKGGWYYDTDPAVADPTRILLCDASCKKVQMTAGVSVDLRLGCKTIVIN